MKEQVMTREQAISEAIQRLESKRKTLESQEMDIGHVEEAITDLNSGKTEKAIAILDEDSEHHERVSGGSFDSGVETDYERKTSHEIAQGEVDKLSRLIEALRK